MNIRTRNNIDAYKEFIDRVGRRPCMESNAELSWVMYIGKAASDAKAKGESHPLMDVYIANGKLARTQLIEDNIALILTELHKMPVRWNIDDTVQRLAVSLIEHIDGFDPTRGFALSTYCLASLVHNARRQDGQEEHTIRKPVHVLKEISYIKRAMDVLEYDHYGPFSRTQIVEIFNTMSTLFPNSKTVNNKTDPIGRIIELLGWISESHADGDGQYNEDGDTLFDSIECPWTKRTIRSMEDKVDLERILKQAKPSQQLALSLRYLHDMTYEEMNQASPKQTSRQNQEQTIKNGLKSLGGIVDPKQRKGLTPLQQRRAEAQMAQMLQELTK